MPEKSSRNCRIYRRSRDGWREEKHRGWAKRFTCKTAAPPPPSDIRRRRRCIRRYYLQWQAHSFPRHGKLFAEFSTVWKLFLRFFHSMENFLRFFPRYGKNFGEFSTLWKKYRRVFHAMENFFPHRGKRTENACFQPVPGCWFGAVERSTPRPM